MAGRRTRAKPSRWQAHLAAAGTPAQELAVAYDRLRSAMAHSCRKRRDVTAARRDETLAAVVAREAANYLAQAAIRLETGARDGDAA